MRASTPATTMPRSGRRIPAGRHGRRRILAGISVLLAGCSEATPSGPCPPEACEPNGICTAIADIAYCVCGYGFHPEGLRCVENGPDPCAGVTCSGHGTCRVEGAAPVCDCAAGYVPEPVTRLSCLPEPAPDARTDDGGRDDAAEALEDAGSEPPPDIPDTAPPPRCGDGRVDEGEECDDENATPGDGCEPDCRYSCHADSDCDSGRWCVIGFCDADHRCNEMPGPDGTACYAGLCCSGECVETAFNDEHCGDCSAACGSARYCWDSVCYDRPTFEQGPDCADLGVAHPPPDTLSYYVVHGRPGAEVHKWNLKTSCPGATPGLAPETEPPNPPMVIGADGSVRFSIETMEPITDCAFENLGTYESWVVVDTLESNHVSSAFYNSLCPDVATCALGAAACP